MADNSKAKADAKIKNKVGLDIGSHSIKMIEIGGTADSPVLLRIGVKKIAGALKEGMANTIKSMSEELGISTKDVNVQVSGPSVTIRFVSMPKMKPEELKSALKFEAEKLIPFDINDCVLGFQDMGKNERDGKSLILLAAAKKNLVEDRIKLAEDCGFSVSVVDVDGFALINAFSRNFTQLDKAKTVAVLNIGYAITNVCLVKGGAPCFFRDVAIGGKDFDAAVIKGLKVDEKAAEELKIAAKDRMDEVKPLLRSTTINLLDELRLSFSYYENQSGQNISEIYITGGSAALPGLSELFEEALGSKPDLWDPLKFFGKEQDFAGKDKIDSIKNYFGVASGLALR